MQVLNTKVVFNAVKNNGGWAITGDIDFNKITLNIGNGMKSTGFVAPYSGHYKFSLSAMTGFKKWGIRNYVDVLLNGDVQFGIGDSNDGSKSDGNNFNYVWIMQVGKGQSVSLKIGSGSYLCADTDVPITFTGELVHLED